MKYFFVFLMPLLSAISFGQNKNIDSLKFKLQNTKTLEDKVNVELKLAVEYIKIRELGKASEVSNSALLKGIEIKDPAIIADAYLNLGNINYINWNGPEAIDYYQKVDSVLSANNIINKTLYKSKSNIGNLMFRTANDSLDFVKIKKYFNESLEIAKVLNDSTQQAYILTKLGDLHQSKKENDSAIIKHKKAEKFIKKDDIKSLSNLYWALASVYLAKKDYVNGKKYTFKRYNLIKNSNNLTEKASANWVHGSLLFMAKDYKSAIEYNKLSISLYDSLDYKDYGRLAGAASNVYNSYYELGDYKSALDYLEISMVYQDSALARTRNNKIEELETKYQTEKKEQEIALLASQNALIEQKQKSQQKFYIGAISLTTIAGIFLFILYNNRKKTNIKLKELDKAKSNFFTNISHEFRTPLALINTPIENTLEDKTIDDDKRQQFIIAKRNSDRLLDLVNQVLDLSKIDAGELKLHVQKGNVTQFISALSESFIYQAQQKQIQLHIDIDHKDKTAFFDKDAIEKIIVNLLSNAIKYTPKDGEVFCIANINDNRLYIEVKNSGKGLSKEELLNIFQRFYQTDEKNNGSGVGLALIKELVELHKGTIKATSTPNSFTTFTVTLPIDKGSFKHETFIEAAASENTLNVLSETETQSIINDEFEDNDLPILLIVEDNSDLRTVLKQTFKSNYNILVAKNGLEGTELALEHIPDIIISDIMMPIKDGIALTEQLKNNELTSHIPIILLTAKVGDDNKLSGLEVGADDYITKPFNTKLLLTKTEKLIESRRLLQERYSQELVLLPKDISITNLDEQFLEKVQSILDENLLESSFSITDFSNAAGMSRMQLHRKLKALTGLTATEFIRSQRLKLAAKLLQTSDINISQVGYSVGFNDHSYFAKCFKEVYNCTPTAYAKRN